MGVLLRSRCDPVTDETRLLNALLSTEKSAEPGRPSYMNTARQAVLRTVMTTVFAIV
jgi:hypothetical protein